MNNVEHIRKATFIPVAGLKDYRGAVRADLVFDLSKLEQTNLDPTYFDEATLINNADTLLVKTYSVAETVTSTTTLTNTFGSATTV